MISILHSRSSVSSLKSVVIYYFIVFFSDQPYSAQNLKTMLRTFRGSPKFPHKNLRQIGQGISDLISDNKKQTDRQTSMLVCLSVCFFPQRLQLYIDNEFPLEIILRSAFNVSVHSFFLDCFFLICFFLHSFFAFNSSLRWALL